MNEQGVRRNREYGNFLATHNALPDGWNLQIPEIDTKPGEKMYEELLIMNEEGVPRIPTSGNFCVARSAFADAETPGDSHAPDHPILDRQYGLTHAGTTSRQPMAVYRALWGFLSRDCS